MKERLDYIDILKGVGMSLVVLSHSRINMNLVVLIFAFHMPLFFMISGILSKNKCGNYKEFVMKKFKSLLIPYCIFTIITLFLTLIVEKSFDSKYLIMNALFLNGDVLPLNAPLWFLVVLFIIDISYYFIINRSNKFKILFAIIMSIIGYFNKTILPFGLHVAIVAIVYFTIGDLSKKYINKINLSTVKSVVYIIILGSIFTILGLKNGYVNIYRIQFNNYFLYFLLGILGSVCCLILSKMLLKTKYLKLIFRYIGENSLIIMCLHYYVIKSDIVKNIVIKPNIINNNIGFIISTITIAIIVLIIKLKDIIFSKNNSRNLICN